MTLRARLLASLGVLVAITLVVAGILVVASTRAGLVEQVDEELRETARRPLRGDGPGPGPGRDQDDLTGGRIAWLLVGPEGRIVRSSPSGRAGSPDALPSVDVADAGMVIGGILERPAVEGDLRYRLVVGRLANQGFLVIAAPLDVVDAPIRELVRNLLLVGAVALAGILLATWWIVRRGLRPLETIARTADTIATGKLSHRSELPHDQTEVGRLGSAFDRMLDQIQGAFDEQRSALDAKDASERRLRQFVADASHELRTPLTAVRGYAELYRTGGLSEAEALDRAMTRIETESRRMAGLVDDLLLLARLDQGRPLRRDPVDLSDLVRDAVADARALEPARPLDAGVADGVRIAGDEDRLRQVVGNLLANVRVHTAPDTPVDVVLDAAADRATLRVSDHGPGIDPDHAERVFDRFFRADPGRSRDRGGSGLGLAIAASVVQAHGGDVHHEPTPGGGATFVVTLPLGERPGGTDGGVGLDREDRVGDPTPILGFGGQGVRHAGFVGHD